MTITTVTKVNDTVNKIAQRIKKKKEKSGHT